ncbi:MAG: dihydrofolate reductase [Clostridia bacterium]|nr:dihydrofolate reductase [Clostridia bacterium]
MEQRIVLIAAADRRWAIGKDNHLLYKVSEDMRHFRELTTGNIVIYGRKTLESFPNAKPLRDRLNIVVSGSLTSGDPSLLVAGSPVEALRIAREADPNGEKTVFVCGGASVYRQLLPFCGEAVITRIDAETEDADVFLPDLDALRGWKKISRTGWKESVTGPNYSFVTYRQENHL